MVFNECEYFTSIKLMNGITIYQSHIIKDYLSSSFPQYKFSEFISFRKIVFAFSFSCFDSARNFVFAFGLGSDEVGV